MGKGKFLNFIFHCLNFVFYQLEPKGNLNQIISCLEVDTMFTKTNALNVNLANRMFYAKK